MWTESQTTVRIPQFPGWIVGDRVFIGSGADKGFYLFQLNGNWTIARELLPSFQLFGTLFKPLYRAINSVNLWSAGNLYLWYGGDWRMTAYAGFGAVEEWRWTNEDKTEGRYFGDAWYSASRLPAPGSSAIFSPRGSLRGTIYEQFDTSKNRTLEAVFTSWTHAGSGEAPAGRYTSETDPSVKIVGLPQFKGSDGNTYIRSLEKSAGYYTYGSIQHIGNKWMLGELEGSEPNINAPVTFSANGLPSVTISFDQYAIGNIRRNQLIAEAAIWQ